MNLTYCKMVLIAVMTYFSLGFADSNVCKDDKSNSNMQIISYLSKDMSKSVFEVAWKKIYEFNKGKNPEINWENEKAKTLQDINAAKNDQEFYEILHQITEKFTGNAMKFVPPRYFFEDDRKTEFDIGISVYKLANKLVVTAVKPDSYAEQAGINRGDIILNINGQNCSSEEQLFLRQNQSILLNIKSIDGSLRKVEFKSANLTTKSPMTLIKPNGNSQQIAYFHMPNLDNGQNYNDINSILTNLSAQFSKNSQKNSDLSLIFDLRNNKTSNLKNIKKLLGHFIKGKIMLNHQIKDLSTTLEIKSSALFPKLSKIRILLLVNSTNGSPINVFAAALQAKKGAIILSNSEYTEHTAYLEHVLPDNSVLIIGFKKFCIPNEHCFESEMLIPDASFDFDKYSNDPNTDPLVQEAIKRLNKVR